MFRRSRFCRARWVTGSQSAVAICCCAVVLALPAAAHPKSEPTPAPVPATPPTPLSLARHGTGSSPPSLPKVDEHSGKNGDGKQQADSAPEVPTAPKGPPGAREKKNGAAPKQDAAPTDSRQNGDSAHKKDGADRKTAATPESANGRQNGHTGRGDPPPPHPKSMGTAVGQIADEPTAATTSITDALAAIAAAQQASDPSGMMRLGAAEGQSQTRSKMGTSALQLTPAIGTFRPDEVLGYHLSPEILQQLSATQKYRIEAGNAAGVTRLFLPYNLDAIDELANLQTRFPDQLFGLNYVYSSYRGAGEGSAGPPLSGMLHGCDAARCYGPAMIGWHSDLAACARNVVVGIIDTGLDATHSAVKRLQLIQHPADAQRRGDNSHGTGIAALLGGTRESSTPGLIPDAQFVVVDAFFASDTEETSAEAKPEGHGRQTVTDTDHLLWALETLQHKRAEVINMSLVGPSDAAIHAEIRKMAREGVVFIAAAGNGGPAGAPAYPAAYPEVIAVTAVDRNKHGYAEANHGSYIDVAAPGVRVWTALPGERQGFLSGTSFATPFVTAIAATTYNSTPMKTAVRDPGRTFNSKDEVISRMAVEKLSTGDTGTRDRVFGLGLARAPETCAPPSELQVPVSEAPAPTTANPLALTARGTTWQTQVHRASAAR